MIRALLTIVLAIAVIGAGTASAAHALAHGVPHAPHNTGSVDGPNVAAALAECCDAVGANTDVLCFADILPSEGLLLDPELSAKATILLARVALGQGAGTSVSIGPPKV